MQYPRGFGPTVSDGHIIRTSDGSFSCYTKSLNTRYVLSCFLGFAKANPGVDAILYRSDPSHEQPLARAKDGRIYILSASAYQ